MTWLGLHVFQFQKTMLLKVFSILKTNLGKLGIKFHENATLSQQPRPQPWPRNTGITTGTTIEVLKCPRDPHLLVRLKEIVQLQVCGGQINPCQK